jgi:hypothetical protein
LQGGGQEFESPRLHHLRPTAHTQSKRLGTTPGTDRTRRQDVPFVSPAEASIEPLISVLHARRPPTSGSLGRQFDYGWAVAEARASGPHLNNWIVFRQIEDLRFRRVVKEISRSIPSAAGRLVRCWRGSSYKGHGVDALAPRADEGRGRLRKASGSREQTLIRRCPNGETRLGSCPVTPG